MIVVGTVVVHVVWRVHGSWKIRRAGPRGLVASRHRIWREPMEADLSDLRFGPGGADLSLVRFPPTDLAAIARGYGFDAATVRRPADLDAVAAWLTGDRSRPLLVDLKVVRSEPSWWLEEAFRGH